MTITMALLADAANIAIGGKVNILGIFRRILATSVPLRHPQLSLVVSIEATPAEKGKSYTLEPILMDADGHCIGGFGTFQFTVPASPVPLNPDLTLIIGIAGLALPAYGQYAFRLLIDNQDKLSVPLSVEPFEQPSLPLSPTDEQT